MSESAFREWQVVHEESLLRVGYVEGPGIAATREVAAPGFVGTRHLHERTEEIMIVVEGEIEVTVGDETRMLGPGDVAVVPRGVVHTSHSLGGATFHLLLSPRLPTDDFVLCPD